MPSCPALPRYRGRFAPSPTGALHFGSLLTAVGSWLRARSQGGEWMLRIEDIDPPREVPGAAQAIIDTLAAFGLHSDAPVLYQSQRLDAYAEALEQLIATGCAFPCRCSRSELAVFPVHPPRCVAHGANARRPPAWRMRVEAAEIEFVDALQGRYAENLARTSGPFVLRRADGLWAYQLAVVVDDAWQGITEVVRGSDLIDSTPRQILLQQALGLPRPGYLHLPLVCDASGRKLSKQHRDLAVDPSDPLPALDLALKLLGCPPPQGLRTRPEHRLYWAQEHWSLEALRSQPQRLRLNLPLA